MNVVHKGVVIAMIGGELDGKYFWGNDRAMRRWLGRIWSGNGLGYYPV
ncbi:MAG TPA: hypothetical protein VJ719_16210 [Chthoniobacterales bacterium]|nr:hypothetical protein [Chthoniobacterales bacterium]